MLKSNASTTIVVLCQALTYQQQLLFDTTDELQAAISWVFSVKPPTQNHSKKKDNHPDCESGKPVVTQHKHWAASLANSLHFSINTEPQYGKFSGTILIVIFALKAYVLYSSFIEAVRILFM